MILSTISKLVVFLLNHDIQASCCFKVDEKSGEKNGVIKELCAILKLGSQSKNILALMC